jgi:chitin biosynthesis protein CHS5
VKFIIEKKFLILFFRMVPIGSFYLGASSTTPSSAAFGRPQSMSQASLPFSPTSPPSNNSARTSPTSYRASMPAPARGGSSPGLSSAFINQPSTAGRPRFESTLEEGDDPSLQQVELERATSVGSVTNLESKRKSRGVINPGFKFPPSPPMPGPGHASAGTQPDLQRKDSSPSVIEDQSSLTGQRKQGNEIRPVVVTPSSIEVPAPPLVEKERVASRASLDEADDDVGDTVDIPLN